VPLFYQRTTMTIQNDVLIPLVDLISPQQLKFELISITAQSSFFVAQIATLDKFNAYSGVSLYVRITGKQLTDLINHSLQKIPLSAELFDGAILLSQLVKKGGVL